MKMKMVEISPNIIFSNPKARAERMKIKNKEVGFIRWRKEIRINAFVIIKKLAIREQ